MFRQNFYLLLDEKNNYSEFLDLLLNEFTHLNKYNNSIDFINSLEKLDNEIIENGLFVFIVDSCHLDKVYKIINDTFNENMSIIVSIYDKLFDNINDFDLLFDFIDISSSSLNYKFFINKLKKEIINKRKSSQLQYEIKQFHEIGKYLSIEKDNIKLLYKIIDVSMKLTNSDAGTIYLVVDKNNQRLSSIKNNNYDEKVLKFAIAKNISIDIDLEESISPLTKESIFGYSVITGDVLRIDDVYSLDSNLSYKHNKNFDLTTGYITKSILSIPMKDKDDNVIGVIQLINKKESVYELIDYTNKLSLKNILKYNNSDELIMNSLASQAAIIITNNILYNEMESQNKYLSFLSKKLLKAHEDERRRIAREIHDGPAQNCSNLSIRLQICKKMFENNNYNNSYKELNVLEQNIKYTLNEIRTIIYDLKPTYLENGLISSIQSHIDIFRNNNIIDVELEFTGDDSSIEYYLTSTIYRIIQESLSNIKRHAEANKVHIDISISDNYIDVLISDDGKGFDVSKINKSNRSLQGGFGLEGIKERVEIINGSIDIISKISEGTIIKIRIPK